MGNRQLDAKTETGLVREVKGNKQDTVAHVWTKEEIATAKEKITKACGPDVEATFDHYFSDGASGEWSPDRIKIARDAAFGTEDHEALHQFFKMLKDNGGAKVAEFLEKTASNPFLRKQLEKLLGKDNAEALKQLDDPEERVAFVHQFVRLGQLKVGPQTKTFFAKVANALNHIRAVFNAKVREAMMAQKDAAQMEKILANFADGMHADPAKRAETIAALAKDTALHEAVVDKYKTSMQNITNTYGKYMMSARAMMENTHNKYFVGITRMFDQGAGEAMLRDKDGKPNQAYYDRLRMYHNEFASKLEGILLGHTPESIEAARYALSTNTPAKDGVSGELVKKVQKWTRDMEQFLKGNDVRRWDADAVNDHGGKGAWVPIGHIDNYFTRVWDYDYLADHNKECQADLLKHHMNELEAIAREANGELANLEPTVKGGAADKELKRALAEFDASGKVIGQLPIGWIEPSHVAEAIVTRLLNSNGVVDMSDQPNKLGITPAAASVNKRTLSWINMEHFDKYTSKDLVHILHSYERTMVKRGVWQNKFGYGGEKLDAQMDRGFLHEIGGDKLVKAAEAYLPSAIAKWRKRAADFYKNPANDGQKFEEPYPTLRSVGYRINKVREGEEAHAKAVQKAGVALKQGVNAVMAMSGTLGADISPGMRKLNGNMVAYQSMRLLSTMLFTGFNDIVYPAAASGNLGDMWGTFVRGIQGVKDSWQGKHADDVWFKRGQAIGACDGGAIMGSMGQLGASVFMSRGAKGLTDKFFRWTGNEGWNTGIRADSVRIAERVIKEFHDGTMDIAKDKDAKAQFERLYGEGFDPKSIKYAPDGMLDLDDMANRVAVNRFVLDTVVSPNAAHRPIWGSNPMYQMFMHLKNFTYSYHQVILKSAMNRAGKGNLNPLLTLTLTSLPVMIAAGAMKAMLIPGASATWMAGGLAGYLSYAFTRAGALGVPQMYMDSIMHGHFADLAGPAAGQAADLFDDTLGHNLVKALPGQNIAGPMISDMAESADRYID